MLPWRLPAVSPSFVAPDHRLVSDGTLVADAALGHRSVHNGLQTQHIGENSAFRCPLTQHQAETGKACGTEVVCAAASLVDASRWARAADATMRLRRPCFRWLRAPFGLTSFPSRFGARHRYGNTMARYENGQRGSSRIWQAARGMLHKTDRQQPHRYAATAGKEASL